MMLDGYFRATNEPASFRIALLVPQTLTKATATISDVTQIAASGGYTAVNGATGLTLARSAAGWDAITENTVLNYVTVAMADAKFLSTGKMPATGESARWAAICDAATPNNIIAIIDLEFPRDVPVSGWELTIENTTLVIGII